MTERASLPDAEKVARTAVRPDDLRVVSAGTPLVRIHPMGGAHPTAWDEMRAFGPTGARFDHHPPPGRAHPVRKVMYVAEGGNALTCALAETYQHGRSVGPIDRSVDTRAVTVFALAEDVPLLDLGRGWLARAGGNQAVVTGARGTSRAWARAIYTHHQQLAGLAYRSSVWGPGRCFVLWERAVDALPATPLSSRLLVDPTLYGAIAASADQLEVGMT